MKCLRVWRVRNLGGADWGLRLWSVAWVLARQLCKASRAPHVALHWASSRHGGLQLLDFPDGCSGRTTSPLAESTRPWTFLTQPEGSRSGAPAPFRQLHGGPKPTKIPEQDRDPPCKERRAEATIWKSCGMGNTVSTFEKYDLTQILKNKILKVCAVRMAGLWITNK